MSSRDFREGVSQSSNVQINHSPFAQILSPPGHVHPNDHFSVQTYDYLRTILLEFPLQQAAAAKAQPYAKRVAELFWVPAEA